MKRLQKSVIAIVLVMCLLFSEMATLISYAIESHDSNFDFIENELNQSTEESIDKNEPITEIDLTISEDTIYTLEENKVNFTLILKNTSPENELFENPIIEIELPEEIEEAKIDKVMMLYKNGLSISKWNVKEENSKKYLYIELEGIQTEYQNSSIIDGTNVIIQTTLKPYETTPIKESTLKLRYENSNKNIDYLQEEKEYKEYDIQFMSRYGLLTLNGIENLSIENEKELAIGKSLETIDLDIESNAQILNHEMAIVNNYTESLKDVEIIGNIATENNENLLEQNLENTFTSTLLTTINTQGVENQIYYSDEINPSKDSNTWTQNYEELENISSYKIDIQNLNPGEILKFDYQTQTPENLSYNQTIYSNYEVNYVYDNQEQTEKSMVQAKTEEKEAIYEDCQIQEKVESLDIGIYASKGGKELKDGQEVHEGQIIRYSAVLTNNSENTIHNINVDVSLENGNFYELRTLTADEVNTGNTEEVEFKIYEENKTKTIDNFIIEKIEPGKEASVTIDAVIRKENETNNIFSNFSIYSKDVEKIEMTSIANKIKDSKMNLLVKYGGTENVDSGSNLNMQIRMDISNKSIKDFSKVEFELYTPLEYELNEAFSEEYSDRLNITNIEEKEFGKIIKFYIDELAIGENYTALFIGKSSNIEKNLLEKNYSFYSKAYIEEDIYVSNYYQRAVNQNFTNIIAKLSADKENNTYVYHGDEINYNLNLKNVGMIDADVSIIIELPKGIDFENYNIYIDDKLIETVEITNNKLVLEQNIKVLGNCDIKFKGIVNEERFTYKQESINMFAEIYSTHIEKNIVTSELIYLIEQKKEEPDVEIKDDILDEDDFVLEEDSTDITIKIEDLDGISQNTPPSKDESDSDNNDSNPNNNTSDKNNNITKPENDSNSEDKNEDINKKPQNNKEEAIYSITGNIWLDSNGNGLKENNEKNLNGVKVKLYRTESNISNIDDYISEAKTNGQGAYTFKNLKNGTYIVLFEYDSSLYKVTTYSVNSSALENSKGISKVINSKNVAVTNLIDLNNSNIESINLGIYENTKFDLQLEKYITSVTVKNKKENRTENYEKSDIIKTEIDAKYLAGSEVSIEYKFVISNKGDISGYANEIIDYIPDGLEFNENLNSDWYKGTDNQLHNLSLNDVLIEPGQKIELKLILSKKMTNNNLGTFKNTAKIEKTSNSKDLEDLNLNNNSDDMTLVIAIKSGGVIIYTSIAIISLSVLGVILYNKKFKKLK